MIGGGAVATVISSPFSRVPNKYKSQSLVELKESIKGGRTGFQKGCGTWSQLSFCTIQKHVFSREILENVDDRKIYKYLK